MRRALSTSEIPLFLASVACACLAGCVPDQRPGEVKPTPTAARPPAPVPGVPPELQNIINASASSTAAPRPATAIGAASGNPAASASPATSASAEAPSSPDPLLKTEFRDAFERAAPGADWTLTSPVWKIQGGRLCGQGARNHPAWLKRTLPPNARIEFDATTASPEGDIKAELWGDGRSAAQTVSYNAATSYLTIFGGWKNQFHVLARIDEHAPDRPEIKIETDSQDVRARPVEPNRTYHFKIVRDDRKTVRWFVDDIELFAFTDKAPLLGLGHDHLGFNDWDVPLCFDNLIVVPLPG